MSSARFPLFPLFLLAVVSAQAQPRTCTLTSIPLPVRTEGLSELAGDVILSCSGGTPTPIGSSIPLFTVQATLPTAAGNRILTGGLTDALLLVGEPEAFQQSPCTAEPCGAVAGQPPGLEPGLNRNVYQGRLVTPNTLSFTVPLDGGPQTLRLVNLRVTGAPLSGGSATVSVSVSGPAAVTVTPNAVAVANVATALDFSVRSPDNNTAGVARLEKGNVTSFPLSAVNEFQFNLRFAETGSFGFRARSVAANADAPSAIATQSSPGQSAQARFQMSETGYFNQSFPAINGLSAAGLADSGTRLLARFANIPAGASVYVSTVPLSEFSSSGISARLIGTDALGTGAFVPVTADGAIRGGTVPVVRLPVENGQATAVWEVLAPSVGVDRLTFGAFVSYGAPVADATITVQPSLGPISPTGTVSTPPRFTFAAAPVNAVVIGAGGGGVTPPATGPLTITAPPVLPAGTSGVAYPPFVLTASPLTTGLTWSIIEGVFPPGMSLSPAGLVGGTPLFPGAYAFTVRVQGPFGETATARLGLFVTAAQLGVAPVGTINGQVGTAIAPVALSAVGGTAPLRWFAPPANFPPGLTLDENGIISGVPSVEGFFSVPLFVQDSVGATRSITATFVVTGLLRITTPSPLAAATAGAGHRVVLDAAGGTPPYRWSIVSGALPLGLGLDGAGAITGTALGAAGRFLVEVTDSAGRKAQRPYTIDVVANTAEAAAVQAYPEGFVFRFGPNAAPAMQLLRLATASASPVPTLLTVSTDDRGTWLSVDRTQLNVAGLANLGLANVRVNPQGLAPGSYSGQVEITAGEQRRVLPVTVLVSATPVLTVSPSGLVFVASEGGPATRAQAVAIRSGAAQATGWRPATNATWLRVAVSGTGTLSVEALPGSLPAGDYWGEIQIAADGNALPQVVTALLRVLPAGILPPPVLSTAGLLVTTGILPPPVLSTAGLLVTTGAQNGFVLSNGYRLPVSYFTSRDFGGDPFSWFTLTPPSASVEAGAGQTIGLEVRPSLEAGVRRGSITVATPGGPPRTLELTSVTAASGCRPTRLVPVLASPGTGQTAGVGLPVAVEARLVNDCGEDVNTGGVTLSAGPLGVPLTPVGDGRWLGTWTPSDAAPGPWTVTLSARSAEGLEGTHAVTVNLEESSVPAVYAVVTGGTFSRYRAIAPGAFFTVTGAGLTENNGAAPAVTVGGLPAEVSFASASQLNLRLPATAPAGQTLPLVVRRGVQLSVPEPVAVAAVAPDVFVVARDGRAYGAITDPAFRLYAPDNPAAPGEVIVIFCTGLGASIPAVSLTVGGVAAEVLGAAPAPGFPGLYQVAARLAPATPAGDGVVILNAGGRLSPPVLLPIRR